MNQPRIGIAFDMTLFSLDLISRSQGVLIFDFFSPRHETLAIVQEYKSFQFTTGLIFMYLILFPSWALELTKKKNNSARLPLFRPFVSLAVVQARDNPMLLPPRRQAVSSILELLRRSIQIRSCKTANIFDPQY